MKLFFVQGSLHTSELTFTVKELPVSKVTEKTILFKSDFTEKRIPKEHLGRIDTKVLNTVEGAIIYYAYVDEEYVESIQKEIYDKIVERVNYLKDLVDQKVAVLTQFPFEKACQTP